MNKKWKITLITVVSVLAIFFLYKLLFIRTVNYEIAGVNIPSKYNTLTGTVKPISNYKGKPNLPALQSGVSGRKIGLNDEEVAIARLNWAIFEEWANSNPAYKDWQSNPETFKKANDAFRKQFQNL